MLEYSVPSGRFSRPRIDLLSDETETLRHDVGDMLDNSAGGFLRSQSRDVQDELRLCVEVINGFRCYDFFKSRAVSELSSRASKPATAGQPPPVLFQSTSKDDRNEGQASLSRRFSELLSGGSSELIR